MRNKLTQTFLFIVFVCATSHVESETRTYHQTELDLDSIEYTYQTELDNIESIYTNSYPSRVYETFTYTEGSDTPERTVTTLTTRYSWVSDTHVHLCDHETGSSVVSCTAYPVREVR